MHRRHAAGWLALLATAVATVLPVSGPPTPMRLAADAPPSARVALAFDRAELHRASRSYARPEPLVEVPTVASAPVSRGTARPPTSPPTTTRRSPPPTPAAAGDAWACLRQRESGGNYQRNSGNGYYGAYQFLPTTWWAMMARLGYGAYDVRRRVYVGPYPRADLAPPAVQDQAARNLQAVSGWSQWPQTSRACGLR